MEGQGWLLIAGYTDGAHRSRTHLGNYKRRFLPTPPWLRNRIEHECGSELLNSLDVVKGALAPTGDFKVQLLVQLSNSDCKSVDDLDRPRHDESDLQMQYYGDPLDGYER
jgi:hypothetical protein